MAGTSKQRPEPARHAGPDSVQFLTRIPLTDTRLLLVLLGVCFVFALLLFDPKLSTGGDDAVYIVLAKSILKGSFRNIYEPLAPPHTLYPPGLPAILAPVAAIAGSSFIPMKLVILLCSMGIVWLGYLLLKRLLPERDWIPPLMLVAFCPLLLDYSHWTFSEVPFLFFTVLALWLFDRALRDRRGSVLGFVAAAVATGVAYYVRSQGLFLIAALGLVLLTNRRWKALLITAAVVGLMALPWFIRTQMVPHGGYLPWLLTKDPYNLAAGKLTVGDLLSRFVYNSKLYTFHVIPLIVFPVFGENANAALLGLLGVPLTALTVGGFVIDVRKRKMNAMAWYALLTAGIVLFWPAVWSGDRFLIPILPFMFYYLYLGLRQFGAWVRFRQLASAVTVVVVVLFVATVIGRIVPNVRNLSEYARGDHLAGYDEGFRSYFQAAEWLRDHTDTSAIIVSRKPIFTYVFSGRTSFAYPFVADENRILAAMDSLRATHVFLETFFGTSTRYLYPVIRDHADRFEQIGMVGPRDAAVYIYRVKR